MNAVDLSNDFVSAGTSLREKGNPNSNDYWNESPNVSRLFNLRRNPAFLSPGDMEGLRRTLN
jgi:hypothetical protein